MRSRVIWLLAFCVLVALGAASSVPNIRAQECPGCPGASEGGAYESGNCTCYAWQRASSSSAWNYWFPDALGHAYQWDNEAVREPYNLFVGKIPYPNSIAVWEGNVYPANTVYGHVAYVTGVSGDTDDTFQVDQMNISGYLGCVFPGEYAAKGMGDNLHFIYPPSDRPVPLWPYPELRLEFGEPIVLEWYGSFSYYAVYHTVTYTDGGYSTGVAWDIQGTRHQIGLPHSGRVIWEVCGYNSPGDVEVCSGEQIFHDVLCPDGGASGDKILGNGGDYCPPGENPTPLPTSTPFPTIVPTPTGVSPTNTPLPSPGNLRQASDLQFSPENPLVGEQVHFWFEVTNSGDQVVTYTEIGPWGYGPDHSPWDANNHGHHARNPGETGTINGYRRFDTAGVWTVDGIHYQLLSDSEPRSYYDLTSDGYTAAGMDINVIEPTPTTTPRPLDTPTVSPHDTPTPLPTPTPGGGLATPTRPGTTVTPVTPQPTATQTPGGGIATPTTSGVTVTPVACPPLEGDFDCDCKVTVTDLTQVSNRWRCGQGDGCYEGIYDLNDDDTINIVDIMIVVAFWGESCGD